MKLLFHSETRLSPACEWLSLEIHTHVAKTLLLKEHYILKTVLEVWVGNSVMGIQKAARNNDVARFQETRPMSTTNPMSIQQQC